MLSLMMWQIISFFGRNLTATIQDGHEFELSLPDWLCRETGSVPRKEVHQVLSMRSTTLIAMCMIGLH